jgi:hypothetical protein
VKFPQTSLERALEHVAREPASSLLSGSGPRGFARRVLRRLLWPYFVEQHELNLALTHALRDLAESEDVTQVPDEERAPVERDA